MTNPPPKPAPTQTAVFGIDALQKWGQETSQRVTDVMRQLYIGTTIRRIKTTTRKVEDIKTSLSRIPKQIKATGNRIDKIYSALGVDEFPFALPKTLLNIEGQEEIVKLKSYPQFLEWLTKNLDVLFGEFPISIKIKDADPTKEGEQEKTISLPNVAEALAEIYGLSVQSSINSDLAINFLARLASEVIATKNAALITQDYSRANADYLGYRGNFKAREIDYAFDVTQRDNLPGLLKERKMKIQGWVNEDKETAAAYFTRLMFAAQIIKHVHFRQLIDEDQTIDLLSQIDNLTDSQQFSDDDAWRAFIQRLNLGNSSLFNNDPNAPKPRLDNEARKV